MSFYIKYDDITELGLSTLGTFKNWEDRLTQIAHGIEKIVGMESFQGQTANSVKEYFAQVHITIIMSIMELLREYNTRYLLYKDEYYQTIDSNMHAEFLSDTLNKALDETGLSRSAFETHHKSLERILSNIDNIINIPAPSKYQLTADLEGIQSYTDKLHKDIGNLESNHTRDLDIFKDLANALIATINEWMGKGSDYTYNVNDFANSSNTGKLMDAVRTAVSTRELFQDAIISASDREQERIDLLMKEIGEQRAKDGVFNAVVAVGTMLLGAAAIVATWGAATSVVVPTWAAILGGTAGISAGGFTFVYGASNLFEAAQDVYYGLNDPYTTALNPIRDTIFLSDSKTYQTWGQLSTLVAGAFIPVGQGISIANTTGASVVPTIFKEVGRTAINAVAGAEASYYGYELTGNKWASLVAGMATFGGLDFAEKNFLFNSLYPTSQAKINEITVMQKGNRPDPSTYILKQNINNHLKQFNDGASKIVKEIFPDGNIGTKEGGAYVIPKSVADNAIRQAGGDIRKLETLLGLPKNSLGSNPVRIDVINPSGLKMSNGNEFGANSNWLPGGQTSGGLPEAIIDRVQPGNYKATPINSN